MGENTDMVTRRSSPRMNPAAQVRAAGSVRIVAGRWRGSKLPVADIAGLRPTADRVRETLFNWLQPHLAGARCLDLFAGSGALGFEAASRGASEVVLIEREPRLVALLRESAARLEADNLHIEQADALQWLARAPARAFDVVFVDPPFAQALWAQAARALAPWLSPAAFVYVERGRDSGFEPPADWRLHREAQTREVRYALYRRDATGPTLGRAPDNPSEA